jgi:1-deoxy-D-xylulose-5-phosphate synthase
VLHHLATVGALDNGLKIRPMVLPDVFIDQDKPDAMYAQAKLAATDIAATALAALGKDTASLTEPARA